MVSELFRFDENELPRPRLRTIDAGQIVNVTSDQEGALVVAYINGRYPIIADITDYSSPEAKKQILAYLDALAKRVGNARVDTSLAWIDNNYSLMSGTATILVVAPWLKKNAEGKRFSRRRVLASIGSGAAAVALQAAGVRVYASNVTEQLDALAEGFAKFHQEVKAALSGEDTAQKPRVLLSQRFPTRASNPPETTTLSLDLDWKYETPVLNVRSDHTHE